MLADQHFVYCIFYSILVVGHGMYYTTLHNTESRDCTIQTTNCTISTAAMWLQSFVWSWSLSLSVQERQLSCHVPETFNFQLLGLHFKRHCHVMLKMTRTETRGWMFLCSLNFNLFPLCLLLSNSICLVCPVMEHLWSQSHCWRNKRVYHTMRQCCYVAWMTTGLASLWNKVLRCACIHVVVEQSEDRFNYLDFLVIQIWCCLP